MFLSFIIPVYNTEAYLDECLGSLLEQDLAGADYEIICVNDGSTDGSLQLLRRYEASCPNVRVIDQENGGVCKARNAGLSAAQGDYIWYFDADDFIGPNVLGELKTQCQASGCDRLVIGNYEYIPGSTAPMGRNTSWEDFVVWRSLFRRTFLLAHDLWYHYPELCFGEDALYMYEVKRTMPKTSVLDQPIYFHRIRPGSLTTELNPHTELKRLRCNIRESQILKDYYERRDGILTTETANRFMAFLFGSLYRIVLMPRKDAMALLDECREKGLYPYPTPAECTITKCPEIKRNDLLGKLIDLLYTNLGSPWAFHGMRFLQFVFGIKQKLRDHLS